jgi:gliding motility-associated-like protein
MAHLLKLYQLTIVGSIISLLSNAQVTGIKAIGDPCVDFRVALQITGTTTTQFVSWNFGDPASGTNDTITITSSDSILNPVHTFSGIGVFNVCATFQDQGQPPQTVCQNISIGLCCNGIISANDSCANKNISFNLSTVAVINTIIWNFGDPSSGSSNTATTLTPSHRFSAPGNYTITATVTADCGDFTATKQITVVNCTPPPPCTGNISAIDSCLANGTRFGVSSTSAISAVSWNFGDPSSSSNTSANLSPTHIFSAPGSYTVTAVVTAACGSFTKDTTITIINCTPPPPCTGNISAIDSCLANGTRFGVSSTSAISAVSWNFGDPSSSSNSSTSLTPLHIFSAPGSYTVTAVITAACGSFTIDTTITIINCTPPPTCTGNISAIDSCLANGTRFGVSSTSAISAVSWNFGDPSSSSNTSANLSPTHIFSAPGSYTVTSVVTATCGSFTSDTVITVTNCVVPPCTSEISNTGSCTSTPVIFGINASSAISSVQWNFGDVASGFNNTSGSLTPSHLFTLPGNFTVTAIVNLACGIDTVTKNIAVVNCDTTGNCTLQIANAFSPNSDGINDFFNPRTTCTFLSYNLLIFDRWGQPIYEVKNAPKKWDGRYKGKDCPVGLYVYVLKYQFAGQPLQHTLGSIILLR